MSSKTNFILYSMGSLISRYKYQLRGKDSTLNKVVGFVWRNVTWTVGCAVNCLATVDLTHWHIPTVIWQTTNTGQTRDSSRYSISNRQYEQLQSTLNNSHIAFKFLQRSEFWTGVIWIERFSLVTFLTGIYGAVCVWQEKGQDLEWNCKADIRRIFRIGHVRKERNCGNMFVQGLEMSAVWLHVCTGNETVCSTVTYFYRDWNCLQESNIATKQDEQQKTWTRNKETIKFLGTRNVYCVQKENTFQTVNQKCVPCTETEHFLDGTSEMCTVHWNRNLSRW